MRNSSSKSTRPEMSFSAYDLGFQAVDEHGDPVERSKLEYPYSYCAHVTWRLPGTSGPGEHAVYSDRLIQWDFPKHDALCLKHFGKKGQVWSSRAPKTIEAFLRDYSGQETLELQVVMEGCNPSNGYPYWVFYYRLTSG